MSNLENELINVEQESSLLSNKKKRICKPRIDKELEEKICIDLRSSMTQSAIIKKYGFGANTLNRICARNNIPMKSERARIGHLQTEETKMKISESKKKYWEEIKNK
jgi:hypothetical protein